MPGLWPNTNLYCVVLPDGCCLLVITVAGLTLWIIIGPVSSNRGHHKWVVLPHAVQLLVNNSQYSEASIKKGLAEGHSITNYRRATSDELAWLKHHGAVGSKTSHVMLVSLSKVFTVGRDHGVPSHVLAQLQQQAQLVSLPTTAQAAVPPPQEPTVVAVAQYQAHFNSTEAAIQPVCPATLPAPRWSQQDIAVQQYGLTTQPNAQGQVLRTAQAWLQQLQSWSTTPIRLDRPSYMQLQGSKTWEGTQGEVLRFLGFIHKFMGVQQPTLHHYLNGFLVAEYVSFLKTRGVQPQTLADAVVVAQRVVTFLAFTNKLHNADLGLLPMYKGWLANLAGQLASHLQPAPRPSLQQQEQFGSWMQPEALMLGLHQVMKAATAALGDVGFSFVATKLNMYAAFCCSLFGWLPPLRPSILITLQHPNYSGSCLHPDCQHPKVCLGNRVELVRSEEDMGLDLDSSSVSSSCSSWYSADSLTTTNTIVKIIAPHHKSSKWWRGEQIEVELPHELAQLYLAHYQGGWELLDGLSPTKAPCNYFFVQPMKGQQLLAQQASQIFAKQVLPVTHSFGPQKARSIFVTAANKQQLGEIDGQAAAQVMGHSLKMWDAVYDKEKATRGAANNVAALASWRCKVLAASEAATAAAAAGVATAEAVEAAAATGGDVGIDVARQELHKEYVDLTMDSDSE